VRQITPEHHGSPSAISGPTEVLLANNPTLAGREFRLAG
jgi:hypothetical protein